MKLFDCLLLGKYRKFSLQLRNGNIVYVSRTGTSSPVVNMTVTELMLSDGNWHNLTLHSHNRGVRLIVDGKKAGEELDSEGVHDFLDPYLTSLSIGGARKELFPSSELVPLGEFSFLLLHHH